MARAVARFDDPSSTAVVLDDFPDVDTDAARMLVLLGARFRSLGSRLLVTTRALQLEAASLLHEAQVIDSEDLRLSVGEAAEVAAEITGLSGAGTETLRCARCAQGIRQPSLFYCAMRRSDLKGGHPCRLRQSTSGVG